MSVPPTDHPPDGPLDQCYSASARVAVMRLQDGSHPRHTSQAIRPSAACAPGHKVVGMFAQATSYVPYPSAAVVSSLIDSGGNWSVQLDGDGGKLLADVGVSIGRLPIYKHVRLRIGRVADAAGSARLMLPVTWESVGGPPLFPRMEGTLHVEPNNQRSTRLTLNARYDPPMGALGQLVDRAMMHRLAQSTMDDFMARLARAVVVELQRAIDTTSPM